MAAAQRRKKQKRAFFPFGESARFRRKPFSAAAPYEYRTKKTDQIESALHLLLISEFAPEPIKVKLPHPLQGEGVGCRGTPLLAGVKGFEPLKCRNQNPVPYRLAIPQYYRESEWLG